MSGLVSGIRSRAIQRKRDNLETAVDWDWLEEGEDFQLVSPTAVSFLCSRYLHLLSNSCRIESVVYFDHRAQRGRKWNR